MVSRLDVHGEDPAAALVAAGSEGEEESGGGLGVGNRGVAIVARGI
jgi:hypothetical protein